MNKRLLIIAIILLMCLFAVPTLAAGNIQYIDAQINDQNLVVNNGSKFMLNKDWYDYKFEINSNNNNGLMDMIRVDKFAYESALNEVSFPLESIGEYKVYFLDYKLKDYPTAMALSFLDDSCVVFGTYYGMSQAKIARLAVHEMGHQIDFQLMNESKWNEYRKIRGLINTTTFNNGSATYENRPQEIFAEDFRILFGGESARQAAHLNTNLPNPETIPALRDFFLSLATL